MSDNNRGLQRFLAIVVIAVGVLIAGTSGLCSLWILDSMQGQMRGALSMVAIFGGIPFMIGVGAIWAGVLLWRGPKGRKIDPGAF